jgi:putative membrane protein
MTDYSIFPKINATLNGSSAVLLVTGRVLIARGKMAAHRAVMIAAFVTSSIFLACYLYYHWPGHGGSFIFAARDGFERFI